MRYRVYDLPTKGLGAFTPTASTNPVASSYGLVQIAGSPGTNPVHVPAPTRVWAPTPNNAPKVQGSNCAPDVIFPSTYVASANNMGPVADAGIGMATRRHTPIPVPAVNIMRLGRNAMIAPHIAGRRAMAWPRAFQRFPLISGRSASVT